MSGESTGADVEVGRPLPAHFRPCPKCGTSILMTYRTEADPTGRPADHDCVARLEAVDTLGKVLHPHTCTAMFAHYGPAKKCERLAEEVLASDWLAAHDAATADRVRRETAERIAAAIEAHADQHAPAHTRRTFVAAARIAREQAR